MHTPATTAPPRPAALPVLPATLGDLLLKSRDRAPDAPALIFPDHRLTFGQLADGAWAAAQWLSGLGVGPGDRVGTIMLNSPDYVTLFFGATMIGAVIVPINARYRSYELEFLAKDAGLRVIVTNDTGRSHADLSAIVADALPGLADQPDPANLNLPGFPDLRAVVDLAQAPRQGFLGPADVARAARRADAALLVRHAAGVAARSVAAIIYTSGTTSRRKGAMLSHEALVRGWMMVGRRWGVRPDDRFWDPCPLFHIAAIGPMIFTLGHGAAYVTDVHFDAGRAVRMLERERATLLYPCYPPITQALITHPDFAAIDKSAVRVWLNVAPPETLRRYDPAFPGARQITTYGQTEGGPVSLGDPDDTPEARLSTCGSPIDGAELRVCDPDTGVELPVGQLGEIHFRGYSAFSGYFNAPAKTAETIDAQGWVHTGDAGVMDDNGRITFRGRIKEMMKVGGENVAPAEVEAFLEGHSAIRMVQAMGVPDRRLTEVVAAFVELEPGHSLTEAEVIAYCKGRLSSFKTPAIVRFVTEWPLSATKVQRNVLRQQLLDELNQGG